MNAPNNTLVNPLNPWPSLNYYTENDSGRFFGRDRELEKLFHFIEQERLTIIFGRSGMGKTSLLRAGLAPRLREENHLPILIRIDHSADAEPPVSQVKAHCRTAAEKAGVDWSWISEPPREKATLWEFFCTAELWGPRNDLFTPVLIFDQFEEAFTIGRSNPKTHEFLEQLADLAENRMPSALRDRAMETGERVEFEGHKALYKVVVSLREDYVYRLDSLRSMMPTIMRNRFCLGGLKQSDAAAVVTKAGGKWVSDEVARAIVQVVAGLATQENTELPMLTPDMEIEPAYLSVMCHELFRKMVAAGAVSISIDMVIDEQKGILNAFYERSFVGLDHRIREFVEDELLTSSGFRSTLPVADAVRDGVTEDALEILVHRRLLRFEDRLGTRHVEISHDLLTPLARKSREKRIAEEALRCERERTEKLRAEQRDAKRRQYIAMVTAVVLGVGLISVVFFTYYFLIQEHSAYYRSFTKRQGFIEGLFSRSEAEVRQDRCSYRLTWKGIGWEDGWFKWKPATKMVAVDANLRPTVNCEIRTYLWQGQAEARRSLDAGIGKAAHAAKLDKVVQVELVSDANGEITYERALDRYGRVVWMLVYLPRNEDQPNTRTARFVGPDGFPLLQQDNSAAEYVVIDYDENGFEKRIRYLDEQKYPVFGPNKAFGEAHTYNRIGQMTQQLSIDAGGEPMVDLAGNCGGNFIYDTDGNVVEWQSIGPDLKPMATMFGIANVKRTYDNIGRIVETTFWDTDGHPVVHPEGNHGWIAEYDRKGNEIRRTIIDVDRQPTLHKDGFASVNSRYDSHGYPIYNEFHGLDGKPALTASGYAIIKAKYDKNGNQLELETRDIGGNLVVDHYGIARIEQTFDDRGNIKKCEYFGVDGKPTLHKQGNAGWRAIYDERDNRLEEHYFGIDGRPTLLSDGYAGWRSIYDDRGNELENHWLGIDGKPTLDKSGIAGWRSTYNNRGNKVEYSNLDLDGKPVNINGVATIRYNYDLRGNEKEVTYWGADDRPTVSAEGIAGYSASFDDRGNELERRFFGVDGTPCIHKDGSSGYLHAYDKHGNISEETFLGLVGQPFAVGGIAKKAMKYDNYRREIQRNYYGASGEPVYGKDGRAGYRTLYDARGNNIEETSLGLDGEPMPVKDIVHIWSCFDNRGNEIERKFLGGNRQPVLSEEGVAGWRKKYDNRSKVLETTFFDIDGQTCLNRDGNAGWSRKYDARGNETETAYFCLGGQICLYKDGYAGTRSTYDSWGYIMEQYHFGIDGKPIPINGVTYSRQNVNAQGHVLQIAFFNSDNQRTLNTNGVAGWNNTHDSFGNVVEQALFGVDEKTKADFHETATYRFQYDPYGHLIKQTRFDSTGKKLVSANRETTRIRKYDERGNHIEEMSFDSEGNLYASPRGITGWKAKFDERGNEIENIFHGKDGQPVAYDGQIAGNRATFDEWGHQVAYTFIGVDGNPCRHKDGHIGWLAKFDKLGNEVERTYVGMDGKPIGIQGGIATTKHEYNSRGQETAVSFLDASGKLHRHQDGYAGYRSEYDEKGNLIKKSWFDTNDKPHAFDDSGVAILRMTYNANGKLTEKKLFDERDQPTNHKQYGYHRLEQEYDENGVQRVHRWSDIEGNPVIRGTVMAVSEVGNGEGKKVGLRIGDVIWGYDDWRFSDGTVFPVAETEFREFLNRVQCTGETPRSLTVVRNGTLLDFHVSPGLLGIKVTYAEVGEVFFKKVFPGDSSSTK